MHFADWTPFLADAPQSEKNFAQSEFSPSLAYYLQRIQRLGFSGQRVLDAGCGMGQYSIALAHEFKQVEGIDRNASRLEVAAKMCTAQGLFNVHFREESVEALPYDDESFDAIFCYGVIMFTDVEKTLKEFYRVLAQGGKLYVCLNGDGWNWKMLHERCHNDPTLRNDFEKALYTSLIQRHMPRLQQLAEEPTTQALRLTLRHMTKAGLSMETLANVLSPVIQVRLPELVESVENISAAHKEIFLGDFFAFLLQGHWPERMLGKTRGYLPQDVWPLLEAAGFCHWAWAPEAQLFCVESMAEAQPRYDGIYAGLPAVWEFVARKADADLVPEAERICAEALRTNTPIFCPPLKYPLVYSSTEVFPAALAVQLEKKSAELGEDAFFKKQFHKLSAHAPDDEALLIEIILYVQKALYRHPVFQPSTREGTLSPLAILLSGIGRCGHAAAVICAFLTAAQIPCRLRALRQHIIAEAFVGGRFVIADADAFKHGIIPRNRKGQILSLDDLAVDPWRIDHFPPTGWSCPRTAPQACTPLGYPVNGYVTSGPWHEKGYLSNYYNMQQEKAFPPSQPETFEVSRSDDQVHVRWAPSLSLSLSLSVSGCPNDAVLHYEVCAGTSSRGWTEAQPNKNVTQPCPQDICHVTTTDTHCSISLPKGFTDSAFINITAVGQRFARDNGIFYWPGQEIGV